MSNFWSEVAGIYREAVDPPAREDVVAECLRAFESQVKAAAAEGATVRALIAAAALFAARAPTTQELPPGACRARAEAACAEAAGEPAVDGHLSGPALAWALTHQGCVEREVEACEWFYGDADLSP